MNAAPKLDSANMPDEKAGDGGWDPYRVWKEQVEGVAQASDCGFPLMKPRDTWSPYQVWMDHVARKS